MADAKAKAILKSLVDVNSRARYMIDLMSDLSREVAFGDSLGVPYLTALTVAASGTGSDTSAEDTTTNEATLNVNLDPFINARLPRLSQLQMLDGQWAQGVAERAIIDLKNQMDDNLATYLGTLSYDASATYADNVAGDSLTAADIASSIAGLAAQAGARQEQFGLFLHPYGVASMHSVAGFIPNGSAAEEGFLGIPKVGSVYGVPVFQTQSAHNGRTVACTAVSIATNVATVTVAAGHNIVPGQRITIAGITTPLSTAAAVTSVTATTVVVPLTAGDGAMADGVGTITVEASEGYLVDRSKLWVAQQMAPTVRVVPELVRSGDLLHVMSAWGRIGIAGYVRRLCSPKSSA